MLPHLLLLQARSRATAAPALVAARPSRPALRAFHCSAALRALDMAKVDTTARLAELRKLMKERNVDVYSTGPPRSPTDPRD